LLLNSKEQMHFWRELERVEQWLSTGAGDVVGHFYDSMGRPGTQAFTNYGNHFAVGIARVDRVRQALDQSAPMAQRLMVQQLSGIGLSAVWDILIAACKEIALYYGGAVVTGAVVGGAIGSIAFGVGAAPGAVIGTAAGAQIGMWMLALLGLKELAESLGSMLPAALDHYERGFREAWGATPRDRRGSWNSSTPASGNTYTGAWHMAQGHVIMVLAILTALVAYLTRGRGNKALLMQEIRQSPRLGPKFAEWLIENEGRLLGHPQLQTRPSTPAGMAMGESLPTNGHGGYAPRNINKADADGANGAHGKQMLAIQMSNRPGSVTRNAMSDAEYLQAQEVVGFKGGHFEGAPTSNFAGIDGWLDGTPVQLKNVTGKSLSAIQRNIVGGANDMAKQGYVGDLFIDATKTGVSMEQIARFAKPGSPISNVLNEGSVNNVYIKSPSGWLNITKGNIVKTPGG
jgi:hypothetical protein